MNEHYIKSIDENELFNQLINYCEIFKNKIIGEKKDKIKKSLTFLKNKAKTCLLYTSPSPRDRG